MREGPVRPLPLPKEIQGVPRRWYNSLKASGQSDWFEPSDWAAALYVAEAMHRNLAGGNKFSAVLFSSVWSAMESLLTTEASRRRARIEVERGQQEEESAGPTALDEYRKMVGG